MARPLAEGDTAQALALLAERPLENVFLEHVIRAGVLGRMPGFFGCDQAGLLVGILMVAPGGGTSLEVRDSAAYKPLAELAAKLEPRPRHIIGSEDVTEPFWRAYEGCADPLRWSRREPVYRIDRQRLRAARRGGEPARVRPAAEADLEAVVMSSARQHLEDLGDNPFTADPEGFRARHRRDIRDGRWWVVRERGRICFQAHVGPHNAHAVQVGGVFTPPDLRRRGHASRGVAALVARLLTRHPAVTLFCGEDNLAARGVYERVGFEVVFHNRSFLLEPDGAPCSSAYA